MRNRLLPEFVYTRTFGWMLFTALMGGAFKTLDVFHGWVRLLPILFLLACATWLYRELLREGDFLQDRPARRNAAVTHTAYLVIHFDIRKSPPVATFVDIYSASARHLTQIGSEARADLYVVQAGSYHEASEEMARIAPLYFPWVVPLMTRNQ